MMMTILALLMMLEDNDDDDVMMMRRMRRTMMRTMMRAMMKTVLRAIMTLAGLGFHMQMSTRAAQSSVQPTRLNPFLDDQWSTSNFAFIWRHDHGDQQGLVNKVEPIFARPVYCSGRNHTAVHTLYSFGKNDNYTSNKTRMKIVYF